MYWPKFKQKLFPGQQDNEQVILVLREHWMTFALRLLTWLMFAAFLVIADWAINAYAPALNAAPYVGYISLIKSVYLLFLILGLLIVFVMYYLNIQVITNERIVDITQISLLHHTVAELHLSHIEDVTSEVNGILGTFLDYGNVYVQTAGAVERFTFRKVPNPQRVEKLILDLYEQLPEDQKQK